MKILYNGTSRADFGVYHPQSAIATTLILTMLKIIAMSCVKETWVTIFPSSSQIQGLVRSELINFIFCLISYLSFFIVY